MAMNDSTTKRCTRCGEEYPATTEYFSVDKRNRSGLGATCKPCDNVRCQHYRDNNPDKRREITRRYYKKYPDKVNAANEKWRISNPDKLKVIQKRWRKANPHKKRAQQQRRDAKKHNLPATFTQQDWERALEYFHGCCAYCSNPPSLFDYRRTLHQDHYNPLNKGGGYSSENIVPACQSCNLNKTNSDPLKWIIKHFGKHKGEMVIKRIADYFAAIH